MTKKEMIKEMTSKVEAQFVEIAEDTIDFGYDIKDCFPCMMNTKVEINGKEYCIKTNWELIEIK